MRVGLTGGIASGKSTVSEILAELGAVIIDGDKLAREVVEPGTPGLAPGGRGLRPDDPAAGRRDGPRRGRPDRLQRRGQAQACSRGSCTRWSSRGTPRSRRRPRRTASSSTTSRCSPSPAGPDTFDAVIVVETPVEVQVERMLRDRGWTRADAESRIAAQATPEQRRAIATYLIENTGTLRRAAGPASRRCTPSELAGKAVRCALRPHRLPREARNGLDPARANRTGRAAGCRSGSQVRVVRGDGASERLRSSWRTRSAEMPCFSADVGQLVLPTVDQAVARADDVGRALVEVTDQACSSRSRGLDVEDRQVGTGRGLLSHQVTRARCRRPRRSGSRGSTCSRPQAIRSRTRSSAHAELGGDLAAASGSRPSWRSRVRRAPPTWLSSSTTCTGSRTTRSLLRDAAGDRLTHPPGGVGRELVALRCSRTSRPRGSGRCCPPGSGPASASAPGRTCGRSRRPAAGWR